ncbi:hypothetical protein VTI74DRAFT_6005 [Chaetomium olivicolor]
MSPLSAGPLAAPLLYTLLFSTAAALPSGRPVSARDAFTRLGCFTDGTPRALTAAFKGDDSMTVEMCAAYCSSYRYFGVEYGRECFCGNDRDASSAAVPDSDCSFPCAGDSTEICGAGLRLDVYTNNNYVVPDPTNAAPAGVPYLGCFVDSPARALPERVISDDGMTAAKCAANCAGYTYFGTQWSRECYCGNTAPTEQATQSECNMPCSGNAAEMCGAGMRLSVYGPVGAAPTNPATVGDFTYDGCYTDSVALRVLAGYTFTSPDMTPASCAAICAEYAYFGLEYGSQCFCGVALDPSGTMSPEKDCSMKCSGDDSLICGDANRLTVYKKAASGAPSNPKTVGAFTYQSCWTDAVGARSLAAKSEASNDMTVDRCAAFCDGYAFLGVEYATECFCGNELVGGQSAVEEDCSELCAGNPSQWCGGPNRLNLYAINPIIATLSSSTTPSVASTSISSDSTATSSSDILSASSSPIPSSTFEESTITSSVASSPAAPDLTTTSSSEAPSLSSSSSSSLSSTVTSSTAEESTKSSSSSDPSSSSSLVSSATDSSLTITSSSGLTDSPASTSSLVSSSDAVFPTITHAPELTTVTSCPPSSTLVGGSQTSCLVVMPHICESLGGTKTGQYTAFLPQCTYWLGSPLPTNIASCVPTRIGILTSAASVLYNCLKSSAMCTYASECTTATYTVGQEPPFTTVTTTTAPAPVSPTGLFQNGGFESGDTTGWAFTNRLSPFTPEGVSSARARSGKYAFRAVFLNENGHYTIMTQTAPVEPGANYTISMWVSHDNPASDCTVTLTVRPLDMYNSGMPTVGLKNVPAGVWQELSFTYQSLGTFLIISAHYNCNAKSPVGSDAGKNTIYMDDFVLRRIDT